MTFVNLANKEIICKIVYWGASSSGKTSNIQQIYKKALSDQKGQIVSIPSVNEKTTFFDFLPLELGQINGLTTRMHLYSIANDLPYETTRRLLMRGVDGIVWVVDSEVDKLPNNLKALEELKGALSTECSLTLSDVPIVIQFNKRDLLNVVALNQFDVEFGDAKPLCYEAVASKGIGVMETFAAVTKKILEEIKKGENQ